MEGELVAEAVLARDERRAVVHRVVVARLAGAHEGAEDFRIGALRPREIVENGDAIKRRADADQVAQRLFDTGGGSVVGVEVREVGVQSARHRHTAVAARLRRDHRGVAGAVVLDADQRLDDRSGLDLVVVLADDPFLRGDVGPRQDLGQRLRQIIGRGVDGIGLGLGRPHRRALQARHAVVQEMHVEVGDGFAVVAQFETMVAGDLADVGRLDALGGEDGQRHGDLGGRHGGDHAFLALRDPDLGVGQPGVLERHAVEVDDAAVLGADLAARAGEAAGAAVGQRREAAGVARLQHGVHGALLFDRVADLHRAA